MVFNSPSDAKRYAESVRAQLKAQKPVRTNSTISATRPVRFSSFPTNDFIQPEYASWERITNGMTKSSISAILGEPIWINEGPRVDHLTGEPAESDFSIWGYGWLQYRSDALNSAFRFDIYFTTNRATFIVDPFDGNLSKTGKPTAPSLIIPFDNQSFDHFPRFVDFRWTPASGDYPMGYVVDVENKALDGNWTVTSYRADMPYLCIDFLGKQDSRWRVKATNALGESAWTGYRRFLTTK